MPGVGRPANPVLDANCQWVTPPRQGQGRFAADISFPGQWHMRVVRSDVAHGRLKSIDTSAALKLPGVHAAWTHADVLQIPRIPFRLTGLKQLEP